MEVRSWEHRPADWHRGRRGRDGGWKQQNLLSLHAWENDRVSQMPLGSPVQKSSQEGVVRGNNQE